MQCINNFSTFQAYSKMEVPKIDSESWANSKYYKGGFDPKMSKREASLGK